MQAELAALGSRPAPYLLPPYMDAQVPWGRMSTNGHVGSSLHPTQLVLPRNLKLAIENLKYTSDLCGVKTELVAVLTHTFTLTHIFHVHFHLHLKLTYRRFKLFRATVLEGDGN